MLEPVFVKRRGKVREAAGLCGRMECKTTVDVSGDIPDKLISCASGGEMLF